MPAWPAVRRGWFCRLSGWRGLRIELVDQARWGPEPLGNDPFSGESLFENVEPVMLATDRALQLQRSFLERRPRQGDQNDERQGDPEAEEHEKRGLGR